MTKKKEHKKEQPEQEQEEVLSPNPHSEESQEQQEDATPEKADNYYDQLLRLQADFENYRKRTEREKPMFIRFGKAELIKKLLPLYDTLLKAKDEVNKEDADIEHIKQGLNMIFEEFDKVFKSEGVEMVCSKGKPYDPMTQEVITTIPCKEEDDGNVTDEICRGVTLDGHVIRPAQVIVGKKQEEAK